MLSGHALEFGTMGAWYLSARAKAAETEEDAGLDARPVERAVTGDDKGMESGSHAVPLSSLLLYNMVYVFRPLSPSSKICPYLQSVNQPFMKSFMKIIKKSAVKVCHCV